MKNILVTGGCGFIGTSLINHLRGTKPDLSIRVLDNLSVGTREDLGAVARWQERNPSDVVDFPKGRVVELIAGDIRDPADCAAACRGIDTVVHLAANTGVPLSVEHPRRDMEVNVAGTFNMLEASRQAGVKRFVFASSGAPLGEVVPPIHEEMAPKPVSPYGASKLAGEAYCSAFARTWGLKTVSLRFGNVYGPLSKHKSSVVAKFFKLALAGEPLEIYGDGSQTRDFIYIDDLLQAITAALGADTGGEVFQIATHRETTVAEIAAMIARIVKESTGTTPRIVYSGARLGDVARNFSDISKARRTLGFEPRYDLETGLRRTFAYFNDGAAVAGGTLTL